MSDILNINPLIYTQQTAVNENPETKTETSHTEISSPKRPVHILYYTDPICFFF